MFRKMVLGYMHNYYIRVMAYAREKSYRYFSYHADGRISNLNSDEAGFRKVPCFFCGLLTKRVKYVNQVNIRDL